MLHESFNHLRDIDKSSQHRARIILVEKENDGGSKFTRAYRQGKHWRPPANHQLEAMLHQWSK